MSVSKPYCSDPQNIRTVLKAYRAEDKPTVATLAERLGTTPQNIRFILAENLDKDLYKAEKALRYSRSKLTSNPMAGRSGSRHHNYKGEVRTKEGYLQVKVRGRYVLVHRQMMADALGLKRLPRKWEVHHINEVKDDNRLDNFALVTRAGHQALHAKRLQLRGSSLWELWRSGTSQS